MTITIHPCLILFSIISFVWPVLIQVLSIGSCTDIFVFVTGLWNIMGSDQVTQVVRCINRNVDEGAEHDGGVMVFVGNSYFDLAPVYFIVAAILIVEIRETVCYLRSNYTKVVLICKYISKPRRPKFVAFVFKYLRCEWLLYNWDDKMSQCKLLMFHQWEVPILFRRLFRLPTNQKKIKVPSEVKNAILEDLANEHQGALKVQCSFISENFTIIA
jgi:hypothetical protein